MYKKKKSRHYLSFLW